MSGMCRPCFMFVSTLASSMVLGSVSKSVAYPMLSYVACRAVMQHSGRVGCRAFCSICDACSWGCSPMGSVCISSRRCCASAVHPAAILSAVFGVIRSLLTSVSDAIGDHTLETHSIMGLAMAPHVARSVSLCFPHGVDVSALSIRMPLLL